MRSESQAERVEEFNHRIGQKPCKCYVMFEDSPASCRDSTDDWQRSVRLYIRRRLSDGLEFFEPWSSTAALKSFDAGRNQDGSWSMEPPVCWEAIHFIAAAVFVAWRELWMVVSRFDVKAQASYKWVTGDVSNATALRMMSRLACRHDEAPTAIPPPLPWPQHVNVGLRYMLAGNWDGCCRLPPLLQVPQRTDTWAVQNVASCQIRMQQAFYLQA